MKCSLCESYGIQVTLGTLNPVCFSCINFIKKFEILAPNPFQEVTK